MSQSMPKRGHAITPHSTSLTHGQYLHVSGAHSVPLPGHINVQDLKGNAYDSDQALIQGPTARIPMTLDICGANFVSSPSPSTVAPTSDIQNAHRNNPSPSVRYTHSKPGTQPPSALLGSGVEHNVMKSSKGQNGHNVLHPQGINSPYYSTAQRNIPIEQYQSSVGGLLNSVHYDASPYSTPANKNAYIDRVRKGQCHHQAGHSGQNTQGQTSSPVEHPHMQPFPRQLPIQIS